MVGIPPKTFEHAHSMMDELIQQNDMKQDTTKGFMDKTFIEAFIQDPWLANMYKSTVKEPWLNDMIAPHINPGLIELLGGMFASPQDTTIGQGDFDLSKDTELQQMYLNQRK